MQIMEGVIPRKCGKRRKAGGDYTGCAIILVRLRGREINNVNDEGARPDARARRVKVHLLLGGSTRAG